MMFDKTKPFGAVSGHETGAAYEQNGKLYFANGEPIEAPVDEVPVGEVPVGEAPVDEVPVGEVPVDEVPVDEVPKPKVSRRK
jgi:hypothetical protein